MVLLKTTVVLLVTDEITVLLGIPVPVTCRPWSFVVKAAEADVTVDEAAVVAISETWRIPRWDWTNKKRLEPVPVVACESVAEVGDCTEAMYVPAGIFVPTTLVNTSSLVKAAVAEVNEVSVAVTASDTTRPS